MKDSIRKLSPYMNPSLAISMQLRAVDVKGFTQKIYKSMKKLSIDTTTHWKKG
jgi:hypothetical protein